MYTYKKEGNLMTIEEFVKKYIDENSVSFEKIDKYLYTKENGELLKKFINDNPKKILPEGYVIDRYEKSNYLKLVNLNTLVTVVFYSPTAW
jgi:hypothetical protein